jgi:hypothetical protein
MRELRDRFNETVNLGVLDGREIVYLDMVESRRSLRMQAQLGGRDPVYSTALGKAMVAFLPEDRWGEHLPARLTPRTEASHSSIVALRDDLRRTRERGYGLDDGENEEGVRCLGAPIFNQDGHVVGERYPDGRGDLAPPRPQAGVKSLQRVQGGAQVGRQALRRGEPLIDVGRVAGADQHAGHAGAAEHPCEGRVGHRQPGSGGDLP